VNITVSWDVPPCSLVHLYQLFHKEAAVPVLEASSAACTLNMEASVSVRNVGCDVPNYTEAHPRGQYSAEHE
jgi:hypothetical protein